MKEYSRRLTMILVLGLSLVLGGCSSLMVDAQSPLGATEPSTARVYFALDQGFPGGNAFVTDGTKLLGFIKNGEHFVADLTAGEHLLMLISEQDEAIKANFEAGKSYYIRLFVTPGVMRSRTYWTPLKNTTEDLKLRDEMLKETERQELVPAEAAKWEADEKEDLEERMESFKSGKDEIKQTMGSENAM